MKVHFIKKSEDSYVMFLCEALRFFNINSKTKKLVEDILNGIAKEESIKSFHITEEEYNKVKETVFSEPVKTVYYSNDSTIADDSVLYKLVLNVTNTCNLACKYCYADGGSYSSADCVMDTATAKTAIDLFYSRYKRIKLIQFFGGEPLLNQPVIEFVCKFITELYHSGQIEALPSFGVITNGTIISDNILETLKKYNIGMTVSIDGPQSIHDELRVYKNGEGSYQTVFDNIHRFQQSGVALTTVEVTYNSVHEAAGCSVFDTVKYLRNECKVSNVHIMPVCGKEYELKSRESFVSAVKETFQTMKTERVDYSFALLNLIGESLGNRKAYRHFCSAGVSSYTVSALGDIYPCFMFIGVPQFKMGTVFDKIKVFDNPHAKAILQKLYDFNKLEDGKCKDCFNNRVCSGCLGANYFNSGDVHCPSDIDCEMRRAITEQVIIELSDVYA